MARGTDRLIIDIGSNSIRSAVERGGALKDKRVYTTRLGLGLADTGRLADSTMDASFELIQKLALRAKRLGLRPAAYATSAVRDAQNGREFARRIERGCGVPVEILSGEDEARFAFNGAAGQNGEFDTLLDIGGGSMQVVSRSFAQSFRAGCVRIADIVAGVRAQSGEYELISCEPDPGEWDIAPLAKRRAIGEYLAREVRLPEFAPGRIVGVGGTVTTLAALALGLEKYDADKVEGYALTLEKLGELELMIFNMGDAKRRSIPILAARHDIIYYGACILEYAMRALGADHVTASNRDGMEGYLYELKKRES